MITRTFTCREHQEYGGLGWQPDWVKNQAMVEPLGGMGAAHDILEHPLRGIGGAENEFMAFGSMYWVRGETGWWSSRGNRQPFEDQISTEFGQILERVIQGYETLKDPGRTTRLDDSIEMDLEAAVNNGFRRSLEDDQFDLDGIQRIVRSGGKERVTGWLRKGYRMATNRYKGMNNWQVAHTFDVIMNAADKRLKHAEEGMVLTIRADVRSGEVITSCDWPGEENY